MPVALAHKNLVTLIIRLCGIYPHLLSTCGPLVLGLFLKKLRQEGVLEGCCDAIRELPILRNIEYCDGCGISIWWTECLSEIPTIQVLFLRHLGVRPQEQLSRGSSPFHIIISITSLDRTVLGYLLDLHVPPVPYSRDKPCKWGT
jgi:hypothetical protein